MQRRRIGGGRATDHGSWPRGGASGPEPAARIVPRCGMGSRGGTPARSNRSGGDPGNGARPGRGRPGNGASSECGRLSRSHRPPRVELRVELGLVRSPSPCPCPAPGMRAWRPCRGRPPAPVPPAPPRRRAGAARSRHAGRGSPPAAPSSPCGHAAAPAPAPPSGRSVRPCSSSACVISTSATRSGAIRSTQASRASSPASRAPKQPPARSPTQNAQSGSIPVPGGSPRPRSRVLPIPFDAPAVAPPATSTIRSRIQVRSSWERDGAVRAMIPRTGSRQTRRKQRLRSMAASWRRRRRAGRGWWSRGGQCARWRESSWRGSRWETDLPP